MICRSQILLLDTRFWAMKIQFGESRRAFKGRSGLLLSSKSRSPSKMSRRSTTQVTIISISSFHLSLRSCTNQSIVESKGPNTTSIWRRSEESDEVIEFYSKVAVCLSARCYHCLVCRDLSPNHQFDGVTKAPVCTTWDIKASLIISFFFSISIH